MFRGSEDLNVMRTTEERRRSLGKAFSWMIVLWVFAFHPWTSEAVRIKDIANIEGARGNQLVGYGLVIGLNGTGDRDKVVFTRQTIEEMLSRFGLTTNTRDIKVKNVAAVVVTAILPAFARGGQRIDVVVSSLGDAESLEGGMLLFTPLRGADGQVYAIAQGAVSIGGFNAGGAAATRHKNHPTVGQIPSGATVEREVPNDFQRKENFYISLNNPDFTTATRLAEAVNQGFGQAIARPVNSGSVVVSLPETYQRNPVYFLATVERLEVVPDTVAKVVMDERTGTVVMGEGVQISTVAVAHGSLSIQVKEEPEVSQPEPFSETGETVVVPRTDIGVIEEEARLLLVPKAATIGDLVKGLNAVGATPRDFIAIFQALKAAGALHAVLEIM